MELLAKQVCSTTTWRRYRRRKGYQGLASSATGRKNTKIVRLGGNQRRVWKIRTRPRLKFKIISPFKLWKKLKNAYLDMMLGLAGNVGSLNTNNYFGNKRIPKARQVGPVVYSNYEIEDRLISEIYKALVATRDLAPLSEQKLYAGH